MDRPQRRQERIIDILREAQLRLSQGESLVSVCKSLDISQSSYRRWQIKYGERAKANATTVINGSTKHSNGTRPTPTEDLLSAKGPKASQDGGTPELSKEAEKLLAAANDASGPARNAWLASLALLAYLLVTLGGVSHTNLLLNSPVKLPIIDVDVPLFSFFQYAPLLLLLVQLWLLIQHVLLAGKCRSFITAIAPYKRESHKEHPARQLVDSYVASQILAGPKRSLVVRGLMSLMVFVTFTLLPVVTLLYFQVKFLPYQEVWITYWHRIAVLLELAMLLVVLPIIHLKSRTREVKVGPQAEAWRASPYSVVVGLVFAILVLGFSWLIATVPDEGVERRLLGFIPPNRVDRDEELLNPLVRWAYGRITQADKPKDGGSPADNREADNAEVNSPEVDKGGLLRWLMSYRVLVVEDTDLVSDEGDKYDEVSVVLRERNLRFARLSRSDLHRADLTRADLRGADMWATRVDNAMLEYTQLQGTVLAYSQLQGAILRSAQLQNADLGKAQLQGANLMEAQLQGASLMEAQLQGANLSLAQLQGASLMLAQLQGAYLYVANLRGATLYGAQLQGADLEDTMLEGADLEAAQLQGADLEGAGIWLAKFPGDLVSRSPVPLGLPDVRMSPLTEAARADEKKKLQTNVTDGELLIERLKPILRDDPPKWEDEPRWSRYVSQAKESSPDELIRFLAGIACGDSRGHIANGIARRAEFYSIGERKRHYAKPLARALLQESCEGVKALTDERRATLEALGSAPE